VVNASGGGLTAGVALAVKARAPQAHVYTAEPEGFDDHARSFASGRREANAALSGTICDALMAQTPGEITFAINRALVDRGVTASEQEVAAAVAFAFRELAGGQPGRAVALAALLAGRVDAEAGSPWSCSGGNVDPSCSISCGLGGGLYPNSGALLRANLVLRAAPHLRLPSISSEQRNFPRRWGLVP
jgi:threonine dehydratase